MRKYAEYSDHNAGIKQITFICQLNWSFWMYSTYIMQQRIQRYMAATNVESKDVSISALWRKLIRRVIEGMQVVYHMQIERRSAIQTTRVVLLNLTFS